MTGSPSLRSAARAGAHRTTGGGAQPLAYPHGLARDRGQRGGGGAHGLRSGQDPEVGGEEETMERTSLLTVSLALSLTVLGVTELLHLNGVLAAFVAGIVFNFAGSATPRKARRRYRKRSPAS